MTRAIAPPPPRPAPATNYRNYAFRDNYSFSGVSADTIGRELERIGRPTGGHVTAEDVREAARPATAPLHPAVFDCEPAEASERYYLEQSRKVIRSVVPIYKSDDGRTVKPEVYYVSIVRPETDKRAYAPMNVVVNTPDYQERVRREAMNGLRGWRDRFNGLEGFEAVIREIDNLLTMERAKLQPRPPKKKGEERPRA